MKSMILSLSILLLAGCAIVQPVDESLRDAETDARPPLTSLPPQTLDSDTCGLFIWTRQSPHQFILFEPEQGLASILYQGEVMAIRSVTTSNDWVPGQSVDQTYARELPDPVFNLTGQAGQDGSAGIALENGLLKTMFGDGTQTVMPVIGVYSCNTGTPELAR